MAEKIAVLGLGWLGLPLAKRLHLRGHQVKGSTTSSQKLMQLLQSRFSVRIIKITDTHITGNWKGFSTDISTLIINIPPARTDRTEIDYPAQIEQIAHNCPDNVKIIFISSTSVYGSGDELSVNETTPPAPNKQSGKAVLAAEKVIQNRFGKRATIIRMAGLVGPNRHPGRFLANKKAVPNPEGKVNLIHLDDCVQLITHVIEQNYYGEIVNGCAGSHPTRRDFYTKAAYALSLDPPVFSADKAQSKIVCNQKSVDELGMVYIYDDPEATLHL